jgi:hypothetical protein
MEFAIVPGQAGENWNLCVFCTIIVQYDASQGDLRT